MPGQTALQRILRVAKSTAQNFAKALIADFDMPYIELPTLNDLTPPIEDVKT